MANTPPPLSLSDIVNITVTVSPSAVVANGFNQGLFVGPSTVIPSYGAGARLQQFSSLTAMITAGFTSTMPEYIAAQTYFSQAQPALYIWIGRQDLTAIYTAIPHSGNAGTGYKVGDQVTVVQSGASNGVLTVLAIGGGGAVTSLGTTIGNQGTAYTVANGLATTGGSGTGLEVDITGVGETLLQASQACRAASNTWYGLSVYNPVTADNVAISTWADALWQNTRYYGWTADAAVLNGTTGNLLLQLQTLKLRVLTIYSTTQSGLYPNNIYAAAGLMGVDMGLNTGLANSFFTLAHKQIQGIAAEPLTQTQYSNIINADGLVYGSFGSYQLVEPGFMASGDPSYLWLNLAMLVANLQNNEIAVLQANPAVPQTNAGEHLLIQAANTACQTAANIGFLAGSTWTGATLSIPGVSLTNGQPLNNGYLVQAQPYSQQSPANRAAGQAMPLYVAITTAGAVQSLLIGVYSQL